MATLASVEQLFGSGPKRRHKTVTLPVSGLTVRIQSLTEKDFSDYQSYFIGRDGRQVPERMRNANRIFISMCVVDDDGNRIITGDLVSKLEQWDAADTLRLYNECSAFAGIGTSDIEGLVKNSEETRES